MTLFRIAGFMTARPWLCAALAFAVLLLIHACSTVDRDTLGNPFPLECVATVTPDVQVEYVTRATMIRLQRSYGYGHQLDGLHAVIFGKHFIWVSVDDTAGRVLPDAHRQSVLRHELCHVIKGQWHG